jgi:hypothetical protein
MQPNRRDFVKGLAGAAMAPAGNPRAGIITAANQAADALFSAEPDRPRNVSRLKVAWVHHSAGLIRATVGRLSAHR